MEIGFDSFDERLKKNEDATMKTDGFKRNRKRNMSNLKTRYTKFGLFI